MSQLETTINSLVGYLRRLNPEIVKPAIIIYELNLEVLHGDSGS